MLDGYVSSFRDVKPLGHNKLNPFLVFFKISWVVFLFGDHLRLQVPPLGNLHDESYFLPKCWCKNSSFSNQGCFPVLFVLGLPSIIRSEWQARSFQKGWGGAHHLKMAPFRHLLFKRSRGGSQKFSFMIFFHPFPSPSSLGG